MTTNFHVGQTVNVTANAYDDFHDFVGTITKIGATYVAVKDQDDDVWCVDPDQLSDSDNN